MTSIGEHPAQPPDGYPCPICEGLSWDEAYIAKRDGEDYDYCAKHDPYGGDDE